MAKQWQPDDTFPKNLCFGRVHGAQDLHGVLAS